MYHKRSVRNGTLLDELVFTYDVSRDGANRRQ